MYNVPTWLNPKLSLFQVGNPNLNACLTKPLNGHFFHYKMQGLCAYFGLEPMTKQDLILFSRSDANRESYGSQAFNSQDSEVIFST